MYLCENRGENTDKNGFNKKGFSGVLRSEKIYFSRGKRGQPIFPLIGNHKKWSFFLRPFVYKDNQMYKLHFKLTQKLEIVFIITNLYL